MVLIIYSFYAAARAGLPLALAIAASRRRCRRYYKRQLAGARIFHYAAVTLLAQCVLFCGRRQFCAAGAAHAVTIGWSVA